jgi:hypothetical protein
MVVMSNTSINSRQGAAMLYHGTATEDVNFDMHTEPAGRPASASETFERGSAREGRGSYVAPYDGIHGWFFENSGDNPVTVTVRTAGFYSASKEFRDDGTTVDHLVTDAPGSRHHDSLSGAAKD